MIEFLKKNILIILIILVSIPFVIWRYNKTYNYNSNNNFETKNNSNDENKISKEDKNKDTDGDSISDYDEKNIYKTDPTKKDSDNDGIQDNTEINQKMNPTTEDSDGDGLLDGKAQYKNNIMIAPKDPNPKVANGKKGTWKRQIEIEKTKNIPYYLTTFYEYNPNSGNLNSISEIN